MKQESSQQYSSLISTINTLICPLSSFSTQKSQINDDPSTLIQTYTSIFESLDQLFGIINSNEQQQDLKILEKVISFSFDPLISILDAFSQETEESGELAKEHQKELSFLLLRLSKCAKSYNLFKIVVPSNSTFKLLNGLLQIWKLIPSNAAALDHVVNLVGLLFGRNRDLNEAYTEALFTFLQEYVLETRSKTASKEQYSLILNLIINIIKNLVLQELQQTQDLSKTFMAEALEKSHKDSDAFITKTIEFLLDKYENSKHTGFKRLLKAICEEIFQHSVDSTSPMNSIVGFKLLETFHEILLTSSYALPHKVVYVDLVLYFIKKNFETLYTVSQRVQNLCVYMLSHGFKDVSEAPVTQDPKKCVICSYQKESETAHLEGSLCNSCCILVQHMKVPNSKKSPFAPKQPGTCTLISMQNLGKLLDQRSLILTLLKYKKNSYSSPQKSCFLLLSACGTENVIELLKNNHDDGFYNEVILASNQNDSQTMAMDHMNSSLYESIFVLNMMTQYSKIITSLHELCLILSNEGSCSLRGKAINFLGEVAKTNTGVIVNDEEFMKLLEHRIYDSSSHLRLNALEVVTFILKKRFDSQQQGLFQLVLERCNDISPAVRKVVVAFMLEMLVHEESIEKDSGETLSLFFETFAKKAFDKEDISSTCFTALLHIMFSSFRPHDQTLKKLLPKAPSSAGGLASSAKKKSAKKNNTPGVDKELSIQMEQRFEKVLRLLNNTFRVLGQEWYNKMLHETSKIGALDSKEIVQFISFLLGRVHKNTEDKSLLFSILKPFSENFPAEFVPELTYFQVYLNEYNQKMTSTNENMDERRAVRQICEILQNVITNFNESFTITQIKKFCSLEQELLQIAYRDTQILVSAALKTLCLSAKKITFNTAYVTDAFVKCYNLFTSRFHTNFIPFRNFCSQKSEETTPEEVDNRLAEFRPYLPSLIRSSYIVAYIIKFLGTKDLCSSLYIPEGEMVNSLYEKFCTFLSKSHGLIELNQAGIECVAALWDYNPILALKSKDIIYQYLAPAPSTSETLDRMQLQILSLFHNILSEYKKDNQKFLQKLEENFKQRTPSMKKSMAASTTPRKPVLNSAVEKPSNQSSVIQLISEGMDMAIVHIYEATIDMKLLMVRIVLLMVQEGNCHLHTIFPKAFALVGEDNEDIRACCLEIIETAISKNATFVSFELENALVEAQLFEEKYKKTTSLYVENSEQQKVPAYEAVYEGSIRYGTAKETVIRTCLDAACTLLLTMATSKPNLVRFVVEFICSMPRIKVEHFVKILNGLKTYIERSYHKVQLLLKPIAKTVVQTTSSTRKSLGSVSQPGEEETKMEEESARSLVEMNQDLIFSLLTAVTYTNILIKASKDSSTNKLLLSQVSMEGSISSVIESLQSKLLEVDRSSFIKIDFNYDGVMAVKDCLNQYLEMGNYSTNQSIKDLYRSIKALYKGRTEQMELFDNLRLNVDVDTGKKVVPKKKKVQTKVEAAAATPKKPKFKVMIKRHTTISKKSNKSTEDDEKEEDMYDERLTRKVEFNTEYKTKLRKRRIVDFKEPTVGQDQEIY